MGTLSSLEWGLYQECFDWLVLNFSHKTSGFIYLKTTPEKCFERLKKRNRTEEAAVPFDYLQNLHEKHEQWLIGKQDVAHYLRDIPVLVLEVDNEFEQDPVSLKKLQDKIVSFMTTHNAYLQTPLAPFLMRS